MGLSIRQDQMAGKWYRSGGPNKRYSRQDRRMETWTCTDLWCWKSRSRNRSGDTQEARTWAGEEIIAHYYEKGAHIFISSLKEKFGSKNTVWRPCVLTMFLFIIFHIFIKYRGAIKWRLVDYRVPCEKSVLWLVLVISSNNCEMVILIIVIATAVNEFWHKVDFPIQVLIMAGIWW